jgi:hypothetical protein
MVLESIRHLHRQVFREDLSISPGNDRTCWAYVLNESRPKVGIWHSHLTTSSYNAVYYLQTNPDDGIQLIIPRDLQDPSKGQVIDLPVQEGMLVVMPGWLFHKERPIERRPGALRISINMEVRADQHEEVALFFALRWRSQVPASGGAGSG